MIGWSKMEGWASCCTNIIAILVRTRNMDKKGGPNWRLLSTEKFHKKHMYTSSSHTNRHVSPLHTRIGGKEKQHSPRPCIYICNPLLKNCHFLHRDTERGLADTTWAPYLYVERFGKLSCGITVLEKHLHVVKPWFTATFGTMRSQKSTRPSF